MDVFRKFTVSFFLLLILSVSAVWAGGRSDSQSSANKPVVIRMWSDDGADKEIMTEFFDRFNATIGAEKGIRVEYTVFGSDFQTALDVSYSAGEEPEMYKDTNKLAQHVQEGRVVPLTELPNFQDRLDAYNQYQQEGITQFGGVPYALPFSNSIFAMIYNKDLLARAGITEPPKTWEELERACIAVSRIEPGKYFGTGLPLKWVSFHTSNIMGGITPSIGKFPYNFTTGRFEYISYAPYMQMLARLYKAGAMFPGIETLDNDTFRAQFAEGNVGFIFGSTSSNVAAFYTTFPAKMEWGVALMPTQDPNVRYNGQSTIGTMWAVSSRCRDMNILDKVSEVYRVLASDDLRRELYSAGRSIPIKTDVMEGARPSDRPQWTTYGQLGEKPVIRPFFPDSYFVVEGDNMHTTLTKIILGQVDAVEALTDLDRRSNDAMERAIANGVIKRSDFIDPTVEQKFKRNR